MRTTLLSLPLEMLGERPVFIVLTYPGDWRRWVPNGRVWRDQVEALKKRWKERWGAPVGVWGKEFQRRGAPHTNLWLALPDAVSDEEYQAHQRRTVAVKRAEARFGKGSAELNRALRWEGCKGPFVEWLGQAWSEVVGTQGVVTSHHWRGFNVTTNFWSDAAGAKASRYRLAKYMATEMAKPYQKVPPEGFFGVGRYFGCWGRAQGFKPSLLEADLSAAGGEHVVRVLERYVRVRAHAQARSAEWLDRRFVGDGLTVFGLAEPDGIRLARWARLAEMRASARARWGSGGEAPGGAGVA